MTMVESSITIAAGSATMGSTVASRVGAGKGFPMIVIDTIDDVTALLRPLLATAGVRLVARDAQVDIPKAHVVAVLPTPARALISAMFAQGTSLIVIPQDKEGPPPFTIAPRVRPVA
jgi:hypothetical protein